MTALDHAANVGRHRLAARKDDLYETPAQAVHALLRVERLPHRIWEPACGPGAIVKVLRAAGHDVVATDLLDYDCPDSELRVDLLMERTAPAGVDAIVTNPPFKLADQFVTHALDLVPRVVMLLRLAFLESERRAGILELRPTRARARLQESTADDASGFVERAEGVERNGVRLVRLAPRPRWAGNH